MQTFSIKYLQTGFNNTFKISYTMIKLVSFQDRKDSSRMCKSVNTQTE
jgi:hypothetical protein